MSAETNVTDSGWKSGGIASGEVGEGVGDGDGTTATTLGGGVGVPDDVEGAGVALAVSAAIDEALAGGVVPLAAS